MFEKYNEKARRALFFARYEASKLGSRVIESEHVLLGVLREGEDAVSELFRRFKIKPEDLRREIEGDRVFVERISSTAELPLSEESKKVLAYASHEAESMGHDSVGSEHLLLGLLRVDGCLAMRVLSQFGLDVYRVREEVLGLARQKETDRQKKELPFLAEFGRDLSTLAAEDAFDPLIGREQELERIVQILSRRTKNNPILLGEPGVGKTAIVEGLAQRIESGDVPIPLARKRVVSLDLSLVVAGTKYRGQFEERLKGILAELREHDDLIVFIDEIHSLVGAGSAEGSLDAANILKPALSRGEVSCIGATTLKEYRKHIEKDRSLLRRFQAVQVLPPTAAETLQILQGLRQRYEDFHGVQYPDSVLQAAIAHSTRYIPDRFQPDKAIDVIDEAGAKVKLRRVRDTQNVRRVEGDVADVVAEMKAAISSKDFERAVELRQREIELREELDTLTRGEGDAEGDGRLQVEVDDVEDVISSWTGIPIASLRGDEANRLQTMEQALRRHVVGQDRAINAISRAIRRSRLGVGDPNRPSGSFVFLGPSGVGKTEVARRLAEFLFGTQDALVRFDMSEFMEKHAVSKLIGSPPGYVGHEEGGQLTERIRRQPYSIVLFDEIEKAHPDVSNLLLQILEDGVLTDSYGNRIDFKNSLLILTSNLGSNVVLRGGRIGFAGQETAVRQIEEEILGELRRSFSPEFINRLDEVIVFNPLDQESLRAIVDILVRDANASLATRGMRIEIDTEVGDWLLDRAGVDPSVGARPLRRTIQRHIQDALSDLLIAAEHEVGLVRVSVRQGELHFEEVQEAETAAPSTV